MCVINNLQTHVPYSQRPDDRMSFMCTGECLGGALWWKDLLEFAEEVGFSPPRLVTAHVVTVYKQELKDILG